MTHPLIRIGRIFYAIALIVYGVQQFIFGDFRPVFFPAWQMHLPILIVWAWLFGMFLIGSAVLILIGKNGRKVFLITGTVLMTSFLFLHLPYQFISEPNKLYHLGLWINVLKEFALAGGAFVIAGTYVADSQTGFSLSASKLIPYGSLPFCATMIVFGMTHFVYFDFVATLVPDMFADHAFWAYFSGATLIGAGAFIAMDIRMRPIALLLAIMIFSWFLTLHLPAAFRDLNADRGNNLASSFDALAFSGIALCIAFGMRSQKWLDDLHFNS